MPVAHVVNSVSVIPPFSVHWATLQNRSALLLRGIGLFEWQITR